MNTITEDGITTLTRANNVSKKLEIGTYDIQLSRMGEFQLHHRPNFTLPDKIYGGHDTFSSRCLHTFQEINKGMAVLLSGPKGCGKTLTAKKIATESNLPVVTISVALHGMNFNSFLTDIPNRCVIFIDEFEKVYSEKDARNSFLSLLDGASDNKHLFVLTSNNENIGEFFINRPGRVRYHRKYDELKESVLMEIIADKMPKGKLRTSMENFVKEIGSISPDMLVCLIQECLIHKEEPSKFISFFNIETELTGPYDITIRDKGFDLKPGLTPKQTRIANDFMECAEDEGLLSAKLHYKEGEKYCTTTDNTWNAPYCRAFERMSVDTHRDIRVSIPYAQKSNSNKTRGFSFNQDEIKHFKRSRGVIFITLKNDTEFEFRRAEPLKHMTL